MNLKSLKTEKNVAEIIVEVSAGELDEAMTGAYKKIKNSIAVPGFRKGKAPRKIVERMYGASVLYNDAMDIIVPQALSFIRESDMDVRPACTPEVSDVDIKEDNSGADITLTAAVYPEVTLGEYKGLSAVKPVIEIDESEVERELSGMQNRNASIEKADRPAADGDIAVIDFEGFVDGKPFEGGQGKNYELTLGSNSFIPGFEEKVVGMAVGEERDLDLTFPEEYQEPLAGKAVVFKVKLNEVKEKILPELDDEFAKDVSEFDTLEEYKEDIREKFRKMRQEESDNAFENALLDQIIEAMEVDIPQAMLEEHMEHSVNNFVNQISAYGMNPETYLQMMNITPDMFRENMRLSTEKQLKTGLALEKIAELENIEVSGEDVENEYNEAAERFGMEVDELKKSLTHAGVTSDLKARRAAELVTSSAVALDALPEEPAAVEEAGEPEKPKKKPAAKKPATEKAAETEESATEAEKPKRKPPAKKPATEKAVPEKVAEESAVEAEKPKRKPPAKKSATEKAAAEKSTKTEEPAAEAEKPKRKPAAKKPKLAETEGKDDEVK